MGGTERGDVIFLSRHAFRDRRSPYKRLQFSSWDAPRTIFLFTVENVLVKTFNLTVTNNLQTVKSKPEAKPRASPYPNNNVGQPQWNMFSSANSHVGFEYLVVFAKEEFDSSLGLTTETPGPPRQPAALLPT